VDSRRIPLKTQAWPDPAPTKRCRACHQVLPLSDFQKRPKGAQGVAALCKACIARRYDTETFGCNRCSRRLPGPEFARSSGGAAIQQPCKQCRSSIKASAARSRRGAQGRAPYHLLSEIDEEKGPPLVGNAAATRWHRVRNVRGTEMRGNCSLCGDVPVRWIQSDGHFVCASPARKRQRADRERRRRRLALYGLSMDDYERMAREQGDRCAICGGSQTPWTPMAPLLSTTGPGRFVGCCAACATRG
jgi:hypothetical protein